MMTQSLLRAGRAGDLRNRCFAGSVEGMVASAEASVVFARLLTKARILLKADDLFGVNG